jgi:hypothetical protein
MKTPAGRKPAGVFRYLRKMIFPFDRVQNELWEPIVIMSSGTITPIELRV